MKRCPALLALVVLLLLPGSVAIAVEPSRPNIIYVMLDDAGYGDFSAFGSQYVKTPTFDRLCAEGMKFTNHNLDEDIAEQHDVSESNPEIVKKLASFLNSARTESKYFPAVEHRAAKRSQ